MKFISGINEDGHREYIPLEKAISIVRRGASVKVLTGAGMYWYFPAETVKIENVSLSELQEALTHEQL